MLFIQSKEKLPNSNTDKVMHFSNQSCNLKMWPVLNLCWLILLRLCRRLQENQPELMDGSFSLV